MNSIDSAFTRQLIATVGPAYVLDTPTDCAAFAVQGRVPSLVVAPGSVEELAQVLAAAYAMGAAVVPWGGGTRQGQGRPPARLDLLLRTERLSRVVEYEPADMTISVQAGMTMAALHDALDVHGQMLPVDVALPGRSTVGGVLATAADGPRRPGYGTLRDLLIGIQVVEVTGRISKAGGMVVKNVSGFDLMKLYLGSLGTLAVIVSANFKLLPRPRAATTVLCGFKTRAAVLQMAARLQAGQLGPVAAEYLSGYQVHITADSVRIERADSATSPTYYLAVWAEGLFAAVERQRREVAALAHDAGATEVAAIEGASHAALWQAIADLSQIASRQPGELVMRLSCLPADLARALDDISTTARRYRLLAAVDARALSGIAYVRVAGLTDARPLSFQRELLSRWPGLVVLDCDADLKAQLAIWGTTPGLDLMRRIKQEFDPRGALNPGRFVVS